MTFRNETILKLRFKRTGLGRLRAIRGRVPALPLYPKKRSPRGELRVEPFKAHKAVPEISFDNAFAPQKATRTTLSTPHHIKEVLVLTSSQGVPLEGYTKLDGRGVGPGARSYASMPDAAHSYDQRKARLAGEAVRSRGGLFSIPYSFLHAGHTNYVLVLVLTVSATV